MASNYPFSRILLATEFTEFDAGAERLAFAMAQRCGVPLRVVIPLLSNPEYEANMPDVALKAEQEIAQRIEALRQRAAAANIQLDLRLRRGSEVHAEIVAEAKEAQADLIVLRRRGQPGFLAKLLVGEMVSKVIRDVSCSVMLVPRAAQFWQHGVLAAIGEAASAANIGRISGMIAGICQLPLTILSVAEERAELPKVQSLNQATVDLAAASCNQVHGRVVSGKAVEQTVAAVHADKADLVVIGRQRYHLFPFGNSGIMENIAGALDVPTLVVPT